MPVIVNKNQHVITGGLRPTAAYSRVAMIAFDVVGGVGNNAFAYTKKFGQTLWLLNVQIWFETKTAGTPVAVTWKIVSCQKPPASWNQIANELDPVVDVDYLGMPVMGDRTEKKHYSFDMCKIYTGVGRRFAVGMANGSAPGIIVQASFQISEG